MAKKTAMMVIMGIVALKMNRLASSHSNRTAYVNKTFKLARLCQSRLEMASTGTSQASQVSFPNVAAQPKTAADAAAAQSDNFYQ